ncbi:hypothetical protein EC951288_5211A, partial [Escherichia coli 95.1288]
MGLF